MDMFFKCLLVSLQITAIYVAFFEGNIFSSFRILVANAMDKMIGVRASRIIQKPLWDCLPCMASVWTIILTWRIDIHTITMILVVCGINAILEQNIPNDRS